jgi:hypothetical protein
MRSQLDFSVRELGELAIALSTYQEMAHFFTQLSTTQRESLNKFWTESIVKREKDLWLKDGEINMWNDINVHIVKQTWGNTSCGWEGIGGAAMSSSYTTVIENYNYKFACIFYGKQLAYICKMDEAYRKLDRSSLPGMLSCKRVLDVIYYKYELK